MEALMRMCIKDATLKGGRSHMHMTNLFGNNLRQCIMNKNHPMMLIHPMVMVSPLVISKNHHHMPMSHTLNIAFNHAHKPLTINLLTHTHPTNHLLSHMTHTLSHHNSNLNTSNLTTSKNRLHILTKKNPSSIMNPPIHPKPR